MPLICCRRHALLVLVLAPGVARRSTQFSAGCTLGILNFQPSEAMKFFVVLYASDYTGAQGGLYGQLQEGLRADVRSHAVVGGLLLREPDFGAFAVITVIAMGILFLGGMNWRLLRASRLLVVGSWCSY